MAHAMRLLMRLVESSQRKSGRMQRKEAYEINLEDRERWESWRVFLLKIMETDFAYVSKDRKRWITQSYWTICTSSTSQFSSESTMTESFRFTLICI